MLQLRENAPTINLMRPDLAGCYFEKYTKSCHFFHNVHVFHNDRNIFVQHRLALIMI